MQSALRALRFLDPHRRRSPQLHVGDALQEFSEISPGGAVVICGGEPMPDLDAYFAITRQCLDLGLRSLSVVNGTRIRTADFADRTILEGPDEISISLNGPTAELHDRTRGVRGAFNKAVSALRLLVAARERHPERRTRINVMGLVFDENYRDPGLFTTFEPLGGRAHRPVSEYRANDVRSRPARQRQRP